MSSVSQLINAAEENNRQLMAAAAGSSPLQQEATYYKNNAIRAQLKKLQAKKELRKILMADPTIRPLMRHMGLGTYTEE